MSRRTSSTRLVASAAVIATGVAGLALAPAEAAPAADGTHRAAPALAAPSGERARRYNTKTPTSVGYGGAVTSVDPEASRVGLQVLRSGGNAVDAAVATAAALGVTEPYSAGIGGGGYFVYYDARSGRVRTIDGRETAPATMPRDAFTDPDTGQPYRFTPELVTSGVAVGTPGTLATWKTAVDRWGRRSLARALRPAARLADRGFLVDQTFAEQTEQNRERFSDFPATSKLFLPGGQAPEPGTVLRNRDLAATYRLIARKGTKAFYTGPLAREIARTVQRPPTVADPELPVPPGFVTTRDLARYRVSHQAPTRIRYRGYDVYGMAPSSSGGSTVGEALNILERYDVPALGDTQALHHYLEASALAFADRGEYVGDPRFVDVPLNDLLSDRFARERACEIDPAAAATKPVDPGDVSSYDGVCADGTRQRRPETDTENISTTNLTVADRWGNVVDYTLTIEQTGGSGITVPGRGFLLNNELTDFSYGATYDATDPNRIQPLKRPRSSMSPTLVLRDGRPFLALGSPGGSTIITTVLQMLFNRLDRGMSVQEAIAAPRGSQRNTASITAEPEFIAAYGPALEALGHRLTPAGDAFTSAAQIGAATAIEFGSRGRLTAVSEPVRRGGGSALVVRTRR
ncbi:gamma-glutamyltranspeptidase / glutathione hydrolase [Nocardioides scoriae]|uniref:Glutathione hydrolase proenzyme n=1 Tax=Nocardioides scoriae TaxID=642780 RepID=A0A1H1RL65_9ACTN|nr:gamma-glutamyltransferase [Nocardioides scoriae]SDS36393.1 gamma-glutamyltranspeptidase / glutathione hydrolase [Nocardioides scoriae]